MCHPAGYILRILSSWILCAKAAVCQLPFSGRLSHCIPSTFAQGVQPVKPRISLSSLAEGLAGAYDLFQAGNGWKCELENPPELSCGSYRAVPGVEKMDV